MEKEIEEIIKENSRRNADINTLFNPISGEGSIGLRRRVEVADLDPVILFLPEAMMSEENVRQIVKCGSVEAYCRHIGRPHHLAEEKDRFERLRCRHDFAYWAARYVRIKPKQGGDDVPLILNRPQRRMVMMFEKQRLNGMPVRLMVLKARQWGGSTVTQLYMAWWQLILEKGLNSLVVGHVKTASAEVCGMFDKMMDHYPQKMLYDPMPVLPREPKMKGDRHTPLIKYIPARNAKIKVGSAETPNSARGGDSVLVHCTEVAFWRHTQGKSPEEIIRSACAGAAYLPQSIIVYESTANGTGNFFQREYDAAKRGESQFKPLFVAWWQIEQYALTVERQEEFAEWLYNNRTTATANSSRSEPGCFLWRLWNMGATLEAINWYVMERRKYDLHDDIAAEYPSDDVEAFKNSGAHVFDEYQVERFREQCSIPIAKGEMVAEGTKGEEALRQLRFVNHPYGALAICQQPQTLEEGMVTHRYLAVVDIGGRSARADFSVVCVFDRLPMASGGKPTVVAQWYGHTDIDILAWKAVQIAAFYNHALLVVESNTLETHQPYRMLEGGDQSSFILNEIRQVYDHLYARRQSAEEIRERAPLRYGFHTNVKTKPEIISTLVEVIRDQLYVERDSRCLDEYLSYERKPNGAYGALDGKHDDLLMTRAIGLHICFKEMDMPRIISRPVTTNHSYHRRSPHRPVW